MPFSTTIALPLFVFILAFGNPVHPRALTLGTIIPHVFMLVAEFREILVSDRFVCRFGTTIRAVSHLGGGVVCNIRTSAAYVPLDKLSTRAAE